MEVVKIEDAVGMILGHDITEIVPGEFKGIAFKKGHVIKEEDVEKFLRIGKEHIYVFRMEEDHIHEDEAAIRLGKAFAGPGISFSEPGEGKVNFSPDKKGYLKVNKELLEEVNYVGDLCLATIQGERYVEAGKLVGGCRVIPLTIEKSQIEEVENLTKSKEPVFSLIEFNKLKAALIVTGSEVYKGRIEDKFGPVIEKKLEKFGSSVYKKVIVPDELTRIRDEILKAKEEGAELIIVTGGMSVDPDDKTPGAIKETGAEVITYGTPILPGAMLMLAYLDGVPVFGLPGCVMFAKTTAFDLLLPKVFIGEKVTKRHISRLGYGGQCLSCKVCTFPDCHFGKY